MRKAPAALLVLLALLLPAQAMAAPATGPALPPGDAPVQDAVDWMLSHKDEQGCIQGEPALTAWTTQAAVAAGRDVHIGSPSLVDGLVACPPEPPGLTPSPTKNYPADLANHILAIVAAGEDPRAFGPDQTDWVQQLRDTFNGFQFQAGTQLSALNDDAFAVLALRAADVPPGDSQVSQAAAYLSSNQNGDGGWGTDASSDSLTDMTAVAVTALAAANALEPDARGEAIGYLEARAAANEDGCLAASADFGASVDSTAWATLALLATHRDPRADPWGQNGGPWRCLLANEDPGGGFGPGGNAGWITTPHAVLALSGLPWGQVTPSLVRPSATLTTSEDPLVGEPVDLTAEGVPFAGWQDESGAVLEGTSVEWWPTRKGEHTFQVLLADLDGVAEVATLTVDVRPAPGGGSSGSSGSQGPGDDEAPSQGSSGDERDAGQPTVGLGAPATGERAVPLEVSLTATPADAAVVSFRVDWGDGNTTGWTSASNLSHAYASLGEHELTAWAKDADGDTSEPANATVRITDARPRLTLSGPETAYRGQTVTLTAHPSDPDGPTPELTWGTDDGPPADPRLNLTLHQPGPRTVTATATDQAGQATQASWTVTVLNRAPEITRVGPLWARANSTHALTVEASDPESDPLTYDWRLDEDTATGQRARFHLGTPGNRTLIVNVTDPHGGWALATATLHVLPEDEQPGQAEEDNLTITRSATPRQDNATPAGHQGPAIVQLPAAVTGRPGQATVLTGNATQPNGTITRLVVSLGGPLEVRGTAPFQALIPALPAGSYNVSARAAGHLGQWGPWTNTTLTVTPEEPLTPAGTAAGPAETRGAPLPWLAPLLALALAAATRRWPP